VGNKKGGQGTFELAIVGAWNYKYLQMQRFLFECVEDEVYTIWWYSIYHWDDDKGDDRVQVKKKKIDI
jgi:hypothetical protein